jgi:hypothetical protein
VKCLTCRKISFESPEIYSERDLDVEVEISNLVAGKTLFMIRLVSGWG